jgi:hypothetical protein
MKPRRLRLRAAVLFTRAAIHGLLVVLTFIDEARFQIHRYPHRRY